MGRFSYELSAAIRHRVSELSRDGQSNSGSGKVRRKNIVICYLDEAFRRMKDPLASTESRSLAPKSGARDDNLSARGIYSYRNASAGSTLAADHDGYSVAINDTPIATIATRMPSCARVAKGT